MACPGDEALAVEDMNLPDPTGEASKRATLLRLVEYLESLQTVRNTSDEG